MMGDGWLVLLVALGCLGYVGIQIYARVVQ